MMATAEQRLTRALLDLAAEGGRPPCGDHETHAAWTSDDPDARAWAATACTGCPVLEACGAAADEQHAPFGVWGGRDRARRPRRREDAP